MNVFNYPLARTCVAVILGIALQPFLNLGLWLMTTAIVLALTIVFTLRNHERCKRLNGILLLSCFFASGWLAAFLSNPKLQADHYTRFDNDKPMDFQGRITERLRPSAKAHRYYLELEQSGDKSCQGEILIYVSGLTDNLRIGQRIAFRSRLDPLPPLSHPGQFNYAKFLERKGIYRSARTDSERIVRLRNPEKTLSHYADAIRERIRKNLVKSEMPDETLSVLMALILGQQQDISKETNMDYQFAGAIHILSVSGLHVGFIVLFLRRLFRLFPASGFFRWLSLILTLVFLWAFAVIAGLSPPVVRSVTMFSFIVIGTHFQRSQSLLHVLLISLMLLLWIQPSYLYQAGFQLSYLALIAIVWLQPKFTALWPAKNYWHRNFRDLITVSTAAQIGTLPLCLYYFHQFPGLFLLTNLVVVPFVGLLMGIGMIAVILALFGTVSSFVIWPLDFGIGLLNDFVAKVASFESWRFSDVPFSFFLMWIGYAILILFSWHWENPDRKKLIALAVLIICGQGFFFFEAQNRQNENSFAILNNTKVPVEALIENGAVKIYSGDSVRSQIISDFTKENMTVDPKIDKLSSAFMIGKQKVMRIDSIGYYPKNLKPDILIISHSPKTNFDRMLLDLKPKLVVADASNYKSTVLRLKQSCQKQKIPFHSTYEKGFLKIPM